MYSPNHSYPHFPERVGAALLLIDVINDLEFPGGEELLYHARPMAERIAALKERAKRAGIPAIYVNEAVARRNASFSTHVDHCLRPSVRGREIVEVLRPEADDYFIVVPVQSPALLTRLDMLAESLRFTTLILTGLASSIQVRFAANEAYLDTFRFVVPNDCVASKTGIHTQRVLEHVQSTLDADVVPSTQLPLHDLLHFPSFLHEAPLLQDANGAGQRG